VGIVPAPASPATPALPATAPGVPAGKQLQPPAPAQKPAAPAAPQRGLLQITAPSTLTIGQQFSLGVNVSDVKELASAPVVLTYDPVFVDFISAAEGNFLNKDGKPTVFSSKADAASGTVTVSLARGTGTGGVSGNGTLFLAMFRAKNQGPASFGFRNVNFTAADGRPLSMLPFSIVVEVH